MKRPRLVAFYLPQFHPIPENDAWWGKGFTEWTNVASARPLFHGHYQPHIPADLGFYDLRLPETRRAQAELAEAHGITAFCYYHYWFNGRRLLERPFEEVLASGEPRLPFCLCWANENWTRRWDGQDHQVLIAQHYSDEDDRAHIRSLLGAFRDPRYLRIEGKPLFLVYRTMWMPDPRRTTAIWREEARNGGVGELFLCRVESTVYEQNDPRPLGFDGAVEFQPEWSRLGGPVRRRRASHVYDYAAMVDAALDKRPADYRRLPCVTPGWDNSARRERGATIITGSTPELYGEWLRQVVAAEQASGDDEPVVFVNAWNEWAEANHLEPCRRWGRAYLEATRAALAAVGASPPPARPGAERHLRRRQPTVQALLRSAHDSMGDIVREIQAGLEEGHAELAAATVELEYAERLRKAMEELTALVPPGQTMILVDDGEWGPDVVADRCVLPFLERDGHYWGRPADAAAAIDALERLRQEQAPAFLVFGWPAFWWLAHYDGLRHRLESTFPCVLQNDRLIAFDLRGQRSSAADG
jgi:glycosyl transferase family WbsX